MQWVVGFGGGICARGVCVSVRHSRCTVVNICVVSCGELLTVVKLATGRESEEEERKEEEKRKFQDCPNIFSLARNGCCCVRKERAREDYLKREVEL